MTPIVKCYECGKRLHREREQIAAICFRCEGLENQAQSPTEDPEEDGKTTSLQAEIERITEGVRYWSYCMNEGMRIKCPEKSKDLYDFLISLKIEPYYRASREPPTTES